MKFVCDNEKQSSKLLMRISPNFPAGLPNTGERTATLIGIVVRNHHVYLHQSPAFKRGKHDLKYLHRRSLLKILCLQLSGRRRHLQVEQSVILEEHIRAKRERRMKTRWR